MTRDEIIEAVRSSKNVCWSREGNRVRWDEGVGLSVSMYNGRTLFIDNMKTGSLNALNLCFIAKE